MLNSDVVDLSISSDEEEGINCGFHSSTQMLDFMLIQQNLEQYNNRVCTYTPVLYNFSKPSYKPFIFTFRSSQCKYYRCQCYKDQTNGD